MRAKRPFRPAPEPSPFRKRVPHDHGRTRGVALLAREPMIVGLEDRGELDDKGALVKKWREVNPSISVPPQHTRSVVAAS